MMTSTPAVDPSTIGPTVPTGFTSPLTLTTTTDGGPLSQEFGKQASKADAGDSDATAGVLVAVVLVLLALVVVLGVTIFILRSKRRTERSQITHTHPPEGGQVFSVEAESWSLPSGVPVPVADEFDGEFDKRGSIQFALEASPEHGAEAVPSTSAKIVSIHTQQHGNDGRVRALTTEEAADYERSEAAHASAVTTTMNPMHDHGNAN